MIAVLGATGYTGRLVVEHARGLGLPLRLVGRRREALDAMVRDGEEVRVADAKDEVQLRAAFDGATVVVSTAGPFLEVGFAPVEASIGVGAHYLDITGEQAFARQVYDHYGWRARERGVVLLTQFGFDYVPGDIAARLAAEELDEPLDGVAVAYAVAGMGVTRGTLRSLGQIMRNPLVAYADGGIVPSRFGATSRVMRFPFGDRGVVEWGGGEPLTVPRHTRVREVRSYVRAPRAAAPFGATARLVAPAMGIAARVLKDPTPEARGSTRFTVVAEAWNASRGRRATLTGEDVYDLTGRIVAHGAQALANGEARGTGALAPAEAFEARALLERLLPRLRVVDVTDI